jgi:hypothetical protein
VKMVSVVRKISMIEGCVAQNCSGRESYRNKGPIPKTVLTSMLMKTLSSWVLISPMILNDKYRMVMNIIRFRAINVSVCRILPQ